MSLKWPLAQVTAPGGPTALLNGDYGHGFETWPAKSSTQKGGKVFTHRAGDNYIALDTTNRNISRTAFSKALERVPLDGPGQVSDLSAPSYIYGILMDARVSLRQW